MTQTDVEHPTRRRRPFSERLSDAQALGLFSLFVIGSGVVVVWVRGGGDGGGSLLWALGCLAVGALAGFVFGIPRVQQDAPVDQPADGTAPPRVEPPTRRKYKLLANTNLEQIDWLTKIIVGVRSRSRYQLFGRLTRASVRNPPGSAKCLCRDHVALCRVVSCAYLMTRAFDGNIFRPRAERRIPIQAPDVVPASPTTGAPPPTGAEPEAAERTFRRSSHRS